MLIRGNLATGEATTDLKLIGTGLSRVCKAWCRWKVSKRHCLSAGSMFHAGRLLSVQTIRRIPQSTLQGTSVIRDYTVRVYVYGTLLSPQAIFTSEPPLPQEEIISLIATGATDRNSRNWKRSRRARRHAVGATAIPQNRQKRSSPPTATRFLIDWIWIWEQSIRELVSNRQRCDSNSTTTCAHRRRWRSRRFSGKLKYLIRFH